MCAISANFEFVRNPFGFLKRCLDINYESGVVFLPNTNGRVLSVKIERIRTSCIIFVPLLISDHPSRVFVVFLMSADL